MISSFHNMLHTFTVKPKTTYNLQRKLGSSLTLCLLITELILNRTLYLWHHWWMFSNFSKWFPSPLPMSMLVASWKESQEMANMSRNSPNSWLFCKVSSCLNGLLLFERMRVLHSNNINTHMICRISHINRMQCEIQVSPQESPRNHWAKKSPWKRLNQDRKRLSSSKKASKKLYNEVFNANLLVDFERELIS